MANVDPLVKLLSVEQDITAPYTDRESGKPDPVDLRRHVTETQHCFVDFEAEPGKGVTSLNSQLDPTTYHLSDREFRFVGEPIKLNGTPCRVHATIQLATMKGTGRLEIIEE
eukprot:NODE_7268_length_451_cov_34.179012_g7102_i0.p1 GENE.NODE_7268_length_451_cov_34.179012_g7102_i0~~NODE_7268_length_451_cov_34.179012_g7102_i0.p1  ORF type:complete len:131 (-),score=44.28 NODE_7268_length_451_cov_34.179012_g7102_i0:58-393(-)